MKPIQRMVYAAIFLALALLLPFLTGQMQKLGSALLPMHLPILLCGFVCGPLWGAIVGLIAPFLRSLLFGMPPMVPVALGMMCELAAYGFFAGLLHHYLPKRMGYLYVALLGSMVAGRIVLGAANYLIYTFILGTHYTWAMYIGGAVTNALIGIVIQLVLVPPIVRLIQRHYES